MLEMIFSSPLTLIEIRGKHASEGEEEIATSPAITRILNNR